MTQKTVLITGGTGYFGTLLSNAAFLQGYNVRVFDINKPTNKNLDRMEFYQGDIREPDAVRNACAGANIVLHNVAQVPLAKNSELFRTVNRIGTQVILESALDAGIEKVVYTSSSAVFGVPDSNPVNESTPPKPAESYGQAKLHGELLCKEFIDKGLNVSIVRPRTILGHGRLGIFQVLFEWVRCGQNIPVLGSGDNIYQFIHADDLCEIILRVAARKKPDTYNAGATNFCSMRETLEGLTTHAKTKSKVKSLPLKPLEIGMNIASTIGLSPLGKYHSLMYGRSLFFDNSKVLKDLKYKTKHDNISAICDSYDWYLDNYRQINMSSGGSPHQKAVKQGILKLGGYLI